MRNKKLRLSLVGLALIAIAVVYRIATGGVEPSVGLYWTANGNPTAGGGVCAPMWQLLFRTDTPSIYVKTGTPCTAWTAMGAPSSGGTVTSVSCGTGLTCTPNPITGAGTIASAAITGLTTTAVPKATSSTTIGDSAIRDTGSQINLFEPSVSQLTSGAIAYDGRAATVKAGALDLTTTTPTMPPCPVVDFNPITSSQDNTIVRMNVTSACVFAGATAGNDGRLRYWCNVGTANLRITNQDTTETTSSRRFKVPGATTASTYADVPPGYCATTHYDNTSGWWAVDNVFSAGLTSNQYATTFLSWANECLNSNSDSFVTFATAGTGASNGAISGLGRPGLCDMNTGTTATGLARANTVAVHTISTNDVTEVDAMGIGVPTLSSATDEFEVEVGCTSSATAVDQANGCYFLYDRGNVATAPGTGNANSANVQKWKCWCANNSVRTGYIMDGVTVTDGGFLSSDTPIAAYTAPDTGIMSVKMVATPTLVRFFYNGVDSCHITTNIPSTTARQCAFTWFVLKSAGTSNRDVNIDRLQASVALTALRSP